MNKSSAVKSPYGSDKKKAGQSGGGTGGGFLKSFVFGKKQK